MRRLAVLLVFPLLSLQALGQSYRETVQDEARPILWQELFSAEATVARKYRTESWKHLILDGEFNLELNTASDLRLEARGSRALLAQLNVYSLDGTLYLWLNKGLLGPREAGRLTVWLTAPDMVSLHALNGIRITGKVQSVLPQRWRFRSETQVDLDVDVTELDLEATWNSRLSLRGTAGKVFLRPRDNVLIDLRELASETLSMETRGRTQTWVGRPVSIEGTLNPTSVLYLRGDLSAWELPGLRALGRIDTYER